MTNLGLGVMIGMLGGSENSSKAITNSIGKKIKVVELKDDILYFNFEDGSLMSIRDDGQSCCENRYMTTDDDLVYFGGSILTAVEVRDAPAASSEWGDHEVQFLLITTSKGVFTMESHNEHNGYYGGFWIQANYQEAEND